MTQTYDTCFIKLTLNGDDLVARFIDHIGTDGDPCPNKGHVNQNNLVPDHKDGQCYDCNQFIPYAEANFEVDEYFLVKNITYEEFVNLDCLISDDLRRAIEASKIEYQYVGSVPMYEKSINPTHNQHSFDFECDFEKAVELSLRETTIQPAKKSIKNPYNIDKLPKEDIAARIASTENYAKYLIDGYTYEIFNTMVYRNGWLCEVDLPDKVTAIQNIHKLFMKV